MRAIACKFRDLILLPANAIDPLEKNYRTADGIDVTIQFISTWNNKGGEYDEQLDDICNREYNTPFSMIRSIWIGRLGMADEFWHLIRLTKK